MMLRLTARRVLGIPAARALALGTSIWLLLFTVCHFALWREPHSAYFHIEHAYDRDYTLVRQREARQFLSRHANETTTTPTDADDDETGDKAGDDPAICVAMVTVRRSHPDAARYFSDSLGTMLEGLTARERAALHVSVLFGNMPDPARHPDYDAPWLRRIVDHAAGYENITDAEARELRRLEEAEDFESKGVFDYLYVLERCLEATEAPYIAVIEDDVIFAADWLARTLHGLQYLSPAAGTGTGAPPWMYLRLFYTETLMGWNAKYDYAYAHMAWVFALAALTCAAGLLCVHRLVHGCRSCSRGSRTQAQAQATGSAEKGPRPGRCCSWLDLQLDLPTIAVLSLVVTPAFVALAYMAGKYQMPGHALRGLPRTVGSMAPGVAPWTTHAGVVPMDKQGCCSQALVFPRGQVPGLAAYLRARGRGQTDLMIEDYCDDNGLRRFALGEQAVQHVGSVSSRGGGNPSVWAFHFEEARADEVRRRHESLLGVIDWDAFR